MKKRILALVLSVAMVLSFMPFSAFAEDATTETTTANEQYIFQVPENSEDVSIGNLGIAEWSLKEENGERFIVVDGNSFNGGGKTLNFNTTRMTFGADATGLADTAEGSTKYVDLTNVATSYFAIRLKVNDERAFHLAQSRLEIYLGGDASNRITGISTSDSWWYDVNDGSMIKVYSRATNNAVAFVGDMDGWLIVPAVAGSVTETHYQTLDRMDFYFRQEAQGTSSKASNWDDVELYVGDAMLIADKAAFQTTMNTANGIKKYAPNGAEDTAYYAMRVDGTASVDEWKAGGYVNKASGNPTTPYSTTSTNYSFIHKSTLPNGDRAYAFSLNTSAYTTGAGNISMLKTYETSWGGTRNITAGIPSDIDLSKTTAMAFRIATNDGTAETIPATFNFGLSLTVGKSRNNSIYKMSAGDLTYIDANTGAVSTLTVDEDSSITSSKNLDGWLIVPTDRFGTIFEDTSDTSTLRTGWGGHYNASGYLVDKDGNNYTYALKADGAAVYLYEGFEYGKTFYVGDMFFVEDAAAFQAYHTDCAKVGHAYMKTAETAATCTEAGSVTYTCQREACTDKTLTETIPALDHDWELIETIDATCTEAGSKEYKCTRACGVENKITTIKALGHDSDVILEAVEPTYDSVGYTAGTACSVCGEVQSGHEEIPVLESPAYADAVTENESTNGTISADAENKTVTITLNATTIYKTTNPSGTAGYWFGFRLAVPEGVDAANVIYTRPDGQTRVLANILDDGKNYASIYADLEKYGNEITFLVDWDGDGENDLTIKADASAATLCAHEETKTVGKVDATCTDDGYTGDKYCANCQDVLVEKGEVEVALQHTELGNTVSAKEVCGNGCGTVLYDLEALLKTGEATLEYNVNVDAAIVIDYKTTLNLNGKTIALTDKDASGDGIFLVKEGGELTINGEGTLNSAGNASEYKMALWADGGKIIVNGGTYTNAFEATLPQYDLIYVKNGGIIEINGGTFICATPQWTLNSHNTEKGTFVINGGKYYQYDPSNINTDEGFTSWVDAAVYDVVADGDYYTLTDHSCVFVAGEKVVAEQFTAGYTIYECVCGETEKRDYVMPTCSEVQNVKAAQITDTMDLEVTWDALDGADRYLVFVYDEAGEKVGGVTVNDGAATSAIVYDLEVGTYTVMVRARVGGEYTAKYDGIEASLVSILPAAPGVEVIAKTKNSITVKFAAVEGAVKYFVMLEGGDKVFTPGVVAVDGLTEYELTIDGLKANTEYKISINVKFGVGVYTGYEEKLTAKTDDYADVSITAEKTEDGILVEWTVENADKYWLKRVDANGNEVSQLVLSDVTSVIVDDIEGANTFYIIARVQDEKGINRYVTSVKVTA